MKIKSSKTSSFMIDEKGWRKEIFILFSISLISFYYFWTILNFAMKAETGYMNRYWFFSRRSLLHIKSEEVLTRYCSWKVFSFCFPDLATEIEISDGAKAISCLYDCSFLQYFFEKRQPCWYISYYKFCYELFEVILFQWVFWEFSNTMSVHSQFCYDPLLPVGFVLFTKLQMTADRNFLQNSYKCRFKSKLKIKP